MVLIVSNPLNSYGQSEVTEKLNLYKGRAVFYFKSNEDSVKKYSNLGIKLAEMNSNFSKVAEFSEILTEQYLESRKFDLAKESAKRGYVAALKVDNVENKAKLGLLYASSLLKNGDIEEGIEQIRKNLDIANANSLAYYLSQNYSFLALLNCSVENQAMCQYFKRKTDEFKILSERNKFIDKENALYSALKNSNSAKVDSLYSLIGESFLEKESWGYDQINSVFILGKHLHFEGSYDKSLPIFEQLLELNLDPKKCMVNEIRALAANAYLFSNNKEKAFSLNEKVKKSIKNEPHFRFYDKVLETEALLLEKNGKHKEALQSWKNYRNVVDSLANLREHLNRVTVEDIKEFEKTESKYLNVNKENSEYRAFLNRLEKQRFLLWWLSGLLFVLVSVCFYLIFRLNKQSVELKKNIFSIENLNKKLKESNLIKDKLFSLLGHELRSPIAELIGLLDVKKHISKMESALPYLNDIHLKSRALYVRLDNILTWSSSELSNKKTENVLLNLDKLIQETLSLGNSRISHKQQKIIYTSKESWVKGNETQALIVIRNVLHNAVKFSPIDGEIFIDIVEKENFVDLIVTDSGIGFSKEQLENKATGIQESQLGTDGEKGSGVGLYITRDLMHKQGGDIIIGNHEVLGGRITLRFLK